MSNHFSVKPYTRDLDTVYRVSLSSAAFSYLLRVPDHFRSDFLRCCVFAEMRNPSFPGINVISDSHYKFSVRFPSYVVDYMELLQRDLSFTRSSFVSYCVEKWGATL